MGSHRRRDSLAIWDHSFSFLLCFEAAQPVLAVLFVLGRWLIFPLNSFSLTHSPRLRVGVTLASNHTLNYGEYDSSAPRTTVSSLLSAVAHRFRSSRVATANRCVVLCSLVPCNEYLSSVRDVYWSSFTAHRWNYVRHLLFLCLGTDALNILLLILNPFCELLLLEWSKVLASWDMRCWKLAINLVLLLVSVCQSQRELWLKSA